MPNIILFIYCSIATELTKNMWNNKIKQFYLWPFSRFLLCFQIIVYFYVMTVLIYTVRLRRNLQNTCKVTKWNYFIRGHFPIFFLVLILLSMIIYIAFTNSGHPPLDPRLGGSSYYSLLIFWDKMPYYPRAHFLQKINLLWKIWRKL